MPVQLDVGDVLHVAVGGQDAFLVLPSEERHVDLLALVLVRVVLHEGSVYRPEFSVPDRVTGHGAVGHGRYRPVVTDVVEARDERMDHPDGTAMGDDEDLLGRMPLEDVRDEAVHSRGELIERLGVVRSRAFAGAPAAVGVGESLRDLGRGEALPAAEAPLAEPRVEMDLEPELLCDDFRRLACPGEIAGIEEADRAIELRGEHAGLLPAELVEVRVRSALPAPLTVPVGLAVADEKERRHCN